MRLRFTMSALSNDALAQRATAALRREGVLQKSASWLNQACLIHLSAIKPCFRGSQRYFLIALRIGQCYRGGSVDRKRGGDLPVCHV